MVVERPKTGESGQSLVEFLLLLPMLVGLVVVLVRVDTTIQISIVNQQYARSHALFLAYNSPVFPSTRIRERQIVPKQDNQMVIGVSDNVAPSDGSTYVPQAATFNITRKSNPGDTDDQETSQRAKVRVRSTVTLCSQPNVVKTADGYVPILPLEPASGAPNDPVYVATGAYSLSESTTFEYCRGSLQYLVDSDGGT